MSVPNTLPVQTSMDHNTCEALFPSLAVATSSTSLNDTYKSVKFTLRVLYRSQ